MKFKFTNFMTKQTFRVYGTSCKSCEVVIERELKKRPEIVSVNVSHHKQTIQIETDQNKHISTKEINELLKKHHYHVDAQNADAKKTTQSISWQRVGGSIIFVLSLYIIFDQLGLLRLSPSSAEPASLVGVLLIGLLASVSSCTAVVGGLIAAVSTAVIRDQENMTPKERMIPHVYFQLGRIIGFFVLGAFIGYIGSALQLNTTFNGLFVVAVALLMIVIGINLMGVFPFPVVGMPKWMAHKVHDLAESKDPKAPMLLGAMTFFLPCGFTQSMQLFALTLQDPLQSGLVMAVFAIGTAPVLLGIGGASSMVSKENLKYVTQVAGAIVLILGISNVMNGATLLGFSPGSMFVASAKENVQPTSLKNGRQQISMDVTSRGTYEPNVLTVKQGIPVDWTINGADFLGCANSLILPTFGVSVPIKTGKNIVQFTPTKTGKFTYSCSMGMIRGTMIVTQ